MINEMHYLVIDRKAAKLNFCTPKFNMFYWYKDLCLLECDASALQSTFRPINYLNPFAPGFIHFSNLTGLIEKRDKISYKNM